MRELNMRDRFNAKNGGEKPEAYIGETITVVALGEYTDDVRDLETGEVTAKPISVIVTDDGHTITSPSATLNKAVRDLTDLVADEGLETVDVKLAHGVSNSGRKYLTLLLA